jgi:hypothetical protein
MFSIGKRFSRKLTEKDMFFTLSGNPLFHRHRSYAAKTKDPISHRTLHGEEILAPERDRRTHETARRGNDER